MARFITAVYENQRSGWYFRWMNMGDGLSPVSSAQGLIGPCRDQPEADAEGRRFLDAAKKKHPWATFESE